MQWEIKKLRDEGQGRRDNEDREAPWSQNPRRKDTVASTERMMN